MKLIVQCKIDTDRGSEFKHGILLVTIRVDIIIKKCGAAFVAAPHHSGF